MNKPFEIGDYVKCVRPEEGILDCDNIYKIYVMRLDHGELMVGIKPNWYVPEWYADRFELHQKGDALVDASAQTTVAVNNHTCPHCKNDRCSKTEKSCWRCGGKL